MARGRHSTEPGILRILDVLGKIWLLLALWAFYPLMTSILTQWLIGLMLSPMTHQSPSFAMPEVWVIP